MGERPQERGPGMAGRPARPVPEQLERGRTGRPWGAALVAVAIVAVIGVTAARPWGGDPPALPSPAPADVAEATVPPSPSQDVAPVAPEVSARPVAIGRQPVMLPPIAWREILEAVAVPRDAWGIRALAFAPASGTRVVDAAAQFGERWGAADPAALSSGRPAQARAAQPGDVVMALGVTVPPAARPLAIRIWRLDELDLPQRVAAVPVQAGPTAGTVWLAGQGATDLGGWPRGTYRFDVVLADGVVRLVSQVPTPGTLVARSAPLPMGPAPDLTTALADAAPGLFAVSGPNVVAIAAAPGPPLDEEPAWREAGCAAGDAACRVGTLVSRTTSAMGVVLEPGAVPASAVLEQLGPVARVPRTRAEVLELAAAGVSPRRLVALRVDSPGPLSSGLYRLTVAWRTAAGAEREASWHVEIVPPGA